MTSTESPPCSPPSSSGGRISPSSDRASSIGSDDITLDVSFDYIRDENGDIKRVSKPVKRRIPSPPLSPGAPPESPIGSDRDRDQRDSSSPSSSHDKLPEAPRDSDSLPKSSLRPELGASRDVLQPIAPPQQPQDLHGQTSRAQVTTGATATAHIPNTSLLARRGIPPIQGRPRGGGAKRVTRQEYMVQEARNRREQEELIAKLSEKQQREEEERKREAERDPGLASGSRLEVVDARDERGSPPALPQYSTFPSQLQASDSLHSSSANAQSSSQRPLGVHRLGSGISGVGQVRSRFPHAGAFARTSAAANRYSQSGTDQSEERATGETTAGDEDRTPPPPYRTKELTRLRRGLNASEASANRVPQPQFNPVPRPLSALPRSGTSLGYNTDETNQTADEYRHRRPPSRPRPGTSLGLRHSPEDHHESQNYEVQRQPVATRPRAGTSMGLQQRSRRNSEDRQASQAEAPREQPRVKTGARRVTAEEWCRQDQAAREETQYLLKQAEEAEQRRKSAENAEQGAWSEPERGPSTPPPLAERGRSSRPELGAHSRHASQADLDPSDNPFSRTAIEQALPPHLSPSARGMKTGNDQRLKRSPPAVDAFKLAAEIQKVPLNWSQDSRESRSSDDEDEEPGPVDPRLTKTTGPGGASHGSSSNMIGKLYYVNKKLYTRLNMIGKGGSSKVYRVMDSKNQILAMKRVDLRELDSYVVRGYQNEILLLNRLDGHNRIIKLFDSALTSKELHMIMECGEIDFAKLLQEQQSQPLNLTWVAYHWQQILEAVAIIHQEKIVHADLKPANFVLVKGQLKLIDFGIARAIANDTTNIHRNEQVGTLNYMSPEAVEMPEASPQALGRPNDVWALGCILYQMVYGFPPFSKVEGMRKMRAIIDPDWKIEFAEEACPPLAAKTRGRSAPEPSEQWERLKRKVPRTVVETMEACLQRHPKARPTVWELLEHVWLKIGDVEQEHPSEPKVPIEEQLREDQAIINTFRLGQVISWGMKMAQGDVPYTDSQEEAKRLMGELKAIGGS